jgi:hypothetical protein
MSATRDIEAVAEAAADKTIHETFRLFGVDIRDQNQINDFRADLVYARKMRRLHEKAGLKVVMVALALIVGGGLALFWSGFLQAVRK